MRAFPGALALACLFLLAGNGCRRSEDPGPPDDRGALLEGRLGPRRLAGVPLRVYFAPPGPFVRRPLFLIQTPPRVPLVLDGRVVLDGVAEITEALGRPWPFESGLTLQFSGDPTPLVLGWGALLLEASPGVKGGRTRVRGRLEGIAFTHSGAETPFELLFEAPVVLLDGRFQTPGS